jgi:hypothetical protein
VSLSRWCGSSRSGSCRRRKRKKRCLEGQRLFLVPPATSQTPGTPAACRRRAHRAG